MEVRAEMEASVSKILGLLSGDLSGTEYCLKAMTSVWVLGSVGERSSRVKRPC